MAPPIEIPRIRFPFRLPSRARFQAVNGRMWDDLLLFIAIGFAAQLVDGAIGMAFGITAMTFLLSLGATPAVASASVHAAEVFTSAASGISHWRFGNIQWGYFRNLAVGGMLGGAIGAYVLVSAPGEIMRLVVNAYLLGIGVLIVAKALRRALAKRSISIPALRALGFFGGFLDAIGGGGWGPIVTSTLVGRGAVPRIAIGSTSFAEFFVASTIAGTFVATIGLELWPIIVGLIIGGVVSAPLAAYVTRRLPDRAMMILVGVVISLLSGRQLLQWLSG